MVFFFSSYMGAKMFSLAALVAAGGIAVVAVWLVVEFGLLLGAKVGMGNWRFYRRGADEVRFSLLVHFGMCIALLSAPFLLLRNPTFLTSILYSAGLMYMILTNFILQVGIIAYRY